MTALASASVASMASMQGAQGPGSPQQLQQQHLLRQSGASVLIGSPRLMASPGDASASVALSSSPLRLLASTGLGAGQADAQPQPQLGRAAWAGYMGPKRYKELEAQVRVCGGAEGWGGVGCVVGAEGGAAAVGRRQRGEGQGVLLAGGRVKWHCRAQALTACGLSWLNEACVHVGWGWGAGPDGPWWLPRRIGPGPAHVQWPVPRGHDTPVQSSGWARLRLPHHHHHHHHGYCHCHGQVDGRTSAAVALAKHRGAARRADPRPTEARLHELLRQYHATADERTAAAHTRQRNLVVMDTLCEQLGQVGRTGCGCGWVRACACAGGGRAAAGSVLCAPLLGRCVLLWPWPDPPP